MSSTILYIESLFTKLFVFRVVFVHFPGCSGYLVISIWQLTPSCEKQKYTVAVSHTDTPLMVIKEVSHNRLPIQDTLLI